VKLGEERRYRAAPQPGALEDLDRIGEARPEVLDDPFRQGFFGYEGSGARTVAGYYWGSRGSRSPSRPALKSRLSVPGALLPRGGGGSASA
jgi:hypothetical protein